jgi:hypothetical protein
MSQVKFHTVDQPESDITTFVLSCDRLDLLEKTLNSFFRTRDYETKMVIVDDSGRKDIFDILVEKYGNKCDVVCYPTNRGQWWAKDFMVSYCDTEYIFYLEDDWELIKTGYLTKSKEILQKYRDIGTVDISWRTFEDEGIDSYEKELVDNTFYYKKFWRITDYHYHWYGWCGSPNLRRREDYILLGRVEKYYQEIWIDRKFYSLGFKSVYVNDKYVEHLGDNRSRAAAFRANEHLTPEDKYPRELQKNRVWPKFDYLQWDKHYRHPNDITIVTALVDIGRTDRNNDSHYLSSIKRLLETRHPVHVYCDEKYFDIIKNLPKSSPVDIFKFDKNDIQNLYFFNRVNEIISKPEWYEQADWLKNSVNRNPYYIPLTLLKLMMMRETMNKSGASYFYWVDSGIFSSYNVSQNINDFYFTKIPKDKFFIPSFKYNAEKEIHGFNIDKMTEMCGSRPDYVCRATIFGGTKYNIDVMVQLFYYELEKCLEQNCIGTEESLFTILSKKYPQFFDRPLMESGDINNFLQTIKR